MFGCHVLGMMVDGSYILVLSVEAFRKYKLQVYWIIVLLMQLPEEVRWQFVEKFEAVKNHGI